MKIRVDRSLCDDHGQCTIAAAGVFRMNDDGRLEYDPGSGTATWCQTPLALPPKAMQLLVAMLSQPGRLFRRAELEILVWGEAQETSDALRTQISHLRRALTQADGRCPLITVHARGYKLVDTDA